MSEKKNFVVNAEICDARKVQEEGLADYERIVINAALLLVDERSRDVLNRLPVVCNVEDTVEVGEEVHLATVNGRYELKGDMAVEEKTLLYVNGTLEVWPGTDEILQRMVKIYVNGDVSYPESLSSRLMPRLTVNGEARCVPDGCVELEPVFTPDPYFPLCARRDTVYYVGKKIRLTNPKLDIEALLDKKVRFVTKSVVIPEERVEKALPMFDERVKLTVIPAGFVYAGEDVHLDRRLLARYGKRLYIDGILRLDGESKDALEELEKVSVNGEVELLRDQVDAFAAVDAVYDSLKVRMGRRIANKVHMTVDQALLDVSPDGLEIKNCASLTIQKDVRADSLTERLRVRNCAHVVCSPQIRTALETVCENVASISSGEEDGRMGNAILEGLRRMADSRVVNAEKYIL